MTAECLCQPVQTHLSHIRNTLNININLQIIDHTTYLTLRRTWRFGVCQFCNISIQIDFADLKIRYAMLDNSRKSRSRGHILCDANLIFAQCISIARLIAVELFSWISSLSVIQETKHNFWVERSLSKNRILLTIDDLIHVHVFGYDGNRYDYSVGTAFFGNYRYRPLCRFEFISCTFVRRNSRLKVYLC